MSSLILPEQIEQFQTDGAVLLKGVFDEKWVELAKRAIKVRRGPTLQFFGCFLALAFIRA